MDIRMLTEADKININKLSILTLQAYSKRTKIKLETLSGSLKNNIVILVTSFYMYYRDTLIDSKGKLNKEVLLKIINLSLDSQLLTSEARIKDLSVVLNNVNPYLLSAIDNSLAHLTRIVAPLSQMNPTKTLLPDLFLKFFEQANGIVRMLSLNLPSEAYSIWRTLHEAECVIKLLNEGGEALQNSYLKHIVYNNAFRQTLPSKEETDKIFVELKAEMASHNLKSKDMKKFIEYGWLFDCKTCDEKDVAYKLNFRDGLQKAARLEDYSAWYETASELAHSSPIFFYANTDFFMDLTLFNLGDSLVRVVKQLEEYCKSVGIDMVSASSDVEVIINILFSEVKSYDEYFLTKYKDQLIEEDDDEWEDF